MHFSIFASCLSRNWHVIPAHGPCFNGPGNLRVSFLRRGPASMVLATTFVLFDLCGSAVQTCANTLLLTRACLRERAFCTRDARRSNKRSYQDNCLRDAGLFLLQHSANYHTHPTYADLNTTFSGHFHRSASVFRLHFGISVFIESVSELGPTPEPIVSASSSAHPLVAHFPACAECRNLRGRLGDGRTKT